MRGTPSSPPGHVAGRPPLLQGVHSPLPSPHRPEERLMRRMRWLMLAFLAAMVLVAWLRPDAFVHDDAVMRRPGASRCSCRSPAGGTSPC